jgi:hypothetical protein
MLAKRGAHAMIFTISERGALTVNLNDWIDEQGGYAAAAEKLGEAVRTVASWYRFERAPSFSASANIFRETKGLVDFNGIYMPFVEATQKGRRKP